LNGGKDEIYLGSADWMQRNLDHRVEVVFPLEKPEHVRYLRDEVLEKYLHDNLRARVMQADGSYKRLKVGVGQEGLDVQEWLMARASK
jgi:polyphosphate kinase